MTDTYSVGDLSVAVDTVAPWFQPVLWLDDRSLAGYEALARGPEGPLALPLDLFAAAKEHGIVSALESAMTKATLDAVLDRPWDKSVTLFANVEPESMMTPPPPETILALERAELLGVRVVVEITERALLANPASLLASTSTVRSRGWGLAMDDVGADDETLTLLWVLEPDVVKLDMSILHQPFDARAAMVSATVREYCDRTGALMVCEGVECKAHETRARALGADLVQGFFYALPGPRPDLVNAINHPLGLRGLGGDGMSFVDRVAGIPHDSLPGVQVAWMATELVSIASTHSNAAIVLASAPSADSIPDGYLDALAELTGGARLVALIAPGVRRAPAPGVLGVDTDPRADLGCEWSLTVVAPTMAASILSDSFSDEDGDAPVDHRVVHDRPTVAHAARVLLSHIPTTN